MAKAGHWGLSLRRRCGRPMRRKVRITAKDGLCVGLLQVWGQATFGAENRLRRYVDRRSFFVSQLPVQAGSPWPMSGLPSWDTICVVSSGGEFAHSPPFSYAFSGFQYGSALAHPVSLPRWKPEIFGRLNILSFVGAMKIARNLAVWERYVEWYVPHPGSLSEGAVTPNGRD